MDDESRLWSLYLTALNAHLASPSDDSAGRLLAAFKAFCLVYSPTDAEAETERLKQRLRFRTPR